MNLSNDFTLKELCKSSTASRKNIPNTPSQASIENMKKLAVSVLQPLRDNFGRVDLNSGFRSKRLNKAVGGSSTSFHCSGCASDIERAGKASLIEILEWIYYNCEFTELIAEYFEIDGWVHVAYCEGRNHEKTLKLKDKQHNYERVSLEYIKEIYGEN